MAVQDIGDKPTGKMSGVSTATMTEELVAALFATVSASSDGEFSGQEQKNRSKVTNQVIRLCDKIMASHKP
jgi:hypothetical protein